MVNLQRQSQLANFTLTSMPKLPAFKNDEELAAWFDSHDTAAYIDEMEEANETFKVTRTQFPTRPLDVRLRSDFLQPLWHWPNGGEFRTKFSFKSGY